MLPFEGVCVCVVLFLPNHLFHRLFHSLCFLSASVLMTLEQYFRDNTRGHDLYLLQRSHCVEGSLEVSTEADDGGRYQGWRGDAQTTATQVPYTLQSSQQRMA